MKSSMKRLSSESKGGSSYWRAIEDLNFHILLILGCIIEKIPKNVVDQIFENINFQRGLEPKEALGLGLEYKVLNALKHMSDNYHPLLWNYQFIKYDDDIEILFKGSSSTLKRNVEKFMEQFEIRDYFEEKTIRNRSWESPYIRYFVKDEYLGQFDKIRRELLNK